MGLFSIQWKQSAKKELRKLGKDVIPRVVLAVEALADDPHPSGSKKLRGAERTYRIRIGDYRIVYSVLENILRIEVIRVGHRKDIYRKLG